VPATRWFGIEHDHPQPQAHAGLAERHGAALRQQQRHELALAVAQQQPAIGIAAELRPAGRGDGDGIAAATTSATFVSRSVRRRRANCSASSVFKVIDRDQRHRRAGERPDELAQLAVEAGQDEIGDAIARAGGRARWTS
jgi:hypothetical protein